jgi:hypothetical protein
MKVKLLLENKSKIGEQVKELKRPGLNFSQEHGAILAGSEDWKEMSAAIRWHDEFFLTDRFFGMEIHRRDSTLVPRQLSHQNRHYVEY